LFEKEFEKEKKKSLPLYLLSQRPNYPIPQRPVTLLSFLFFPRTLTTGPRLSASPLPFPFFFFTPLPSRPGAAA
jgi:hypothetical protein